MDAFIRISIHALHEESDRTQTLHDLTTVISIHALHEESDSPTISDSHMAGVISIHALHEESDRVRRECNRILKISIHALHEESDALVFLAASHGSQFQSTLSMRRATACLTHQGIEETISIHALHEESDRRQGFERQAVGISIHALHEESDGFCSP